MTEIKLSANASYLPEKVITNHDLSKLMDTTDEWIKSHTGIEERRFAINQNTSQLATVVAKRLLKKANLKSEEIDLIIVSTISPDSITPSTAAIVQKNIKASKAFAYDISAACSGFVFGLSTAEKFLRSGLYKRAMVIASEVNSKMMDFKDRTSTVFFGDGAAGFILERTIDTEMFLAEDLHTLGDENVIHSGRIKPMTALNENNYPKIDAFYQNGRDVYNFVTSTVIENIKRFLKDQKLSSKQIDLIVPHQANLRLIEKISQELKVSLDKFAIVIKKTGNTSSVGIPMALSYALDKGLRPKRVLLCGFGAGLAYGNMLLDLSKY